MTEIIKKLVEKIEKESKERTKEYETSDGEKKYIKYSAERKKKWKDNPRMMKAIREQDEWMATYYTYYHKKAKNS